MSDKFPSFDGTSWWYKPAEVDMSSKFEKELADIMGAVEEVVSDILLSADRTSKHPPYTWVDEDEDEHLRKASRHILTYQMIRDGHQKPDEEDHLKNAICRLSMAVAKRKLQSQKFDFVSKCVTIINMRCQMYILSTVSDLRHPCANNSHHSFNWSPRF